MPPKFGVFLWFIQNYVEVQTWERYKRKNKKNMKPIVQRHTLSENAGGYLLEEFISHYKNRVTDKIRNFKMLSPDQVGIIMAEKQISKLIMETHELEGNIPEFENEALANYYAEGLKLFVKHKDPLENITEK